MTVVDLPHGDGPLSVDLSGRAATVATPPTAASDATIDGDPRTAVSAAMATPHSPPLSEQVGADDQVAIVVTDATRPTPTETLVDGLMGPLTSVGVDRNQITIVVGLGLHRPTEAAERERMLGTYADLAVDHDPSTAVTVGAIEVAPTEEHGDPPTVRPVEGTPTRPPESDAGATTAPSGHTRVPVAVHPAVATADLVCSTGLVEPHQYAGFSGGAKTTVIGAGGEALIGYTHGPDLLSRTGVGLGRIEANPFRTCLDVAGDVAGVAFCLNVTRGPTGLLDASAGRPRAVVADLAATARAALTVEVDGPYGTVLAGIDPAKGRTLYQASRAATYVALGSGRPLAEGGRIVTPAALEEGVGRGTGERRFHDWLADATDPDELYTTMRAGYEPGAQRAFVLARVLREHDVWITDSHHPEVVETCLMTAGETATAIDPAERVLVVPDATNVLLE